MKDIEDEERLRMLSDSIQRKVNEDPTAHDELYKQIGDELIGPLYRWRALATPQNIITAETTELLEKLEKTIYMTIRNHKKNNKDDQNNGNRQK